MLRPPTLTLAALLLLPMLLLAPPAQAAVEDAERTIVFTSPGDAIAWFNGTLRGDEARQIRIFMDADSDGNITEPEARNITLRMIQAGNEHQAWPSTALDGAPPTDVAIVDLEVDNAIGQTNASEPLHVNRVLQLQYAPDTRADNHTWQVNIDEPGRLAQWNIHTPQGYVVTDAQGLGDAQTSDDDSQVSGTPDATTLTIAMSAANATDAGTPGGAAPDANATGDEQANATADDEANATGDDEALPPPQDAQPEEAAEDNDLPAPGLLAALATIGTVAVALGLRSRARR